jgi:hypothetical protein
MSAGEGSCRGVLAQLLRSGMPAEIGAHGVSMRPLLLPGDRLLVEPIAAAQLRLGDVAVIDAPTGPFAHRVVGLSPLVTRGDGASGNDPPIREEAVVGRVRAFRRGRWTVRLDGTVGVLLGGLSLSLGALGRGAVRVLRAATPSPFRYRA